MCKKPFCDAGGSGINSVYIEIAGKDISQAMRPLVHSFFGNISYEYKYSGPDASASAVKSNLEQNEAICNFDIACIMRFCEACMSVAIYQNCADAALRRDCEPVAQRRSDTAPSDIREYRRKAGRLLYECLNEVTGKTLPWGILVGIRPTKPVYEMLESGSGEDKIRRYFSEELYVSDRRTDMALDIAKRERKLLSQFDYRNGYSLYIGIPFCPTTCLYCSFTSYPLAKFGVYMDAYLKALEKEMAYASSAIKDKRLNTVYIGGGTPTALDEEHLEELLRAVHRYFPVESVLEFSVEAGRPDSLTEKKLELLKKYSVNRISINPQSLNQKTLELIGRNHSVESVYEAFETARRCGHDNINMDIIVGLTGEAPEDVARTLEGVKAIRPEALTVHTLALKRAARLKIENERYKGLEATGTSRMLDLTLDFTEKNGYRPYYLYRQKNMAENLENTGYSLPGREGLYNILIMEEKQTILALGAGATTKYVFSEERLERSDNVKSLTDYIGRIDEMIERKRNFLKACYGTE